MAQNNKLDLKKSCHLVSYFIQYLMQIKLWLRFSNFIWGRCIRCFSPDRSLSVCDLFSALCLWLIILLEECEWALFSEWAQCILSESCLSSFQTTTITRLSALALFWAVLLVCWTPAGLEGDTTVHVLPHCLQQQTPQCPSQAHDMCCVLFLKIYPPPPFISNCALVLLSTVHLPLLVGKSHNMWHFPPILWLFYFSVCTLAC